MKKTPLEILEMVVVGACVVAGLVGVAAYIGQDPGPKWAWGMMIVATAGAVILPRMFNLLGARGGTLERTHERMSGSEEAEAVSDAVLIPRELIAPIDDRRASFRLIWRGSCCAAGVLLASLLAWALFAGQYWGAAALVCCAVPLGRVLHRPAMQQMEAAFGQDGLARLAQFIRDESGVRATGVELLSLLTSGSVVTQSAVQLHLVRRADGAELRWHSLPPPSETPGFWIGTWHR